MNPNENSRPSLLPDVIASTKAETIAALAVRLRGLPGINTSAEAVRQACEVLEISESARRFCTERADITREGSYEEGIQIYLAEKARVEERIPRLHNIDPTHLTVGYDEETGALLEVPDEGTILFSKALANCIPVKDPRGQLDNAVRFFADRLYGGDRAEGMTLITSWKESGEMPVGAYNTLKAGFPSWSAETKKTSRASAGAEGGSKSAATRKSRKGRVKKATSDKRLGPRTGERSKKRK
jgi:hypothetical protein